MLKFPRIMLIYLTWWRQCPFIHSAFVVDLIYIILLYFSSPAYFPRSALCSMMLAVPYLCWSHESWWSGPLLHELAYCPIHVHGSSTPHSHELKNTGFPVALKAFDWKKGRCICDIKRNKSLKSCCWLTNWAYWTFGSSVDPLAFDAHQSIFTSIALWKKILVNSDKSLDSNPSSYQYIKCTLNSPVCIDLSVLIVVAIAARDLVRPSTRATGVHSSICVLNW